MRVGLVCPYSFDAPGGVQAHVLDLAAALREMGHETQVLGPALPRAELPQWVTPGGPAVPVRYNGSVARISFGPQVRRTTRQFIEGGDFDVLHVHEPNSPSYSMAAVRMATGPIVATYHASAASSYALKLALPALRGSLEKIRAGIAVSDEAWRWQAEQVGTDPVIIPNGVDTARFAAARRSNASDAVEVVFLGRLDEPRKGLDVFLRAVSMLPQRPRVTVVGAGAQRFVEGVEFTGRVTEDEKAAILGRADIFVAPNLGGESFGIVLVEAMAAGCAVVASDIPAFAAVCGEDAGLLFPPGDAAALSTQLQLLIDDVPLRTRLAESGGRRAGHFDWSVVARQVLHVYEAVSVEEKVGVEAWY